MWRNDLMEKRNFLPIIVCLVISIFLSIEFDYTDSKIINYDTILNLEIAFFSVSLAIVALMITVLEKYKGQGITKEVIQRAIERANAAAVRAAE